MSSIRLQEQSSSGISTSTWKSASKLPECRQHFAMQILHSFGLKLGSIPRICCRSGARFARRTKAPRLVKKSGTTSTQMEIPAAPQRSRFTSCEAPAFRFKKPGTIPKTSGIRVGTRPRTVASPTTRGITLPCLHESSRGKSPTPGSRSVGSMTFTGDSSPTTLPTARPWGQSLHRASRSLMRRIISEKLGSIVGATNNSSCSRAMTTATTPCCVDTRGKERNATNTMR